MAIDREFAALAAEVAEQLAQAERRLEVATDLPRCQRWAQQHALASLKHAREMLAGDGTRGWTDEDEQQFVHFNAWTLRHANDEPFDELQDLDDL
ncbi:MAG: hypothetical protein J2P17_15980 [Mycobacterium sp.]|nr:hypothetical protein [Mycobacterium sp.]